MSKDKNREVALLTTICVYFLDENSRFTEGEIKEMLFDAIDLID